MATCHIALGSNLGNRRANIAAALELIGRIPGTRVVRTSNLLESNAVGGPPDQDRFVNAAAELDTALTPRVLLERLLDIETRLGRVRRERWGPRPIDLDILLWGSEHIEQPDLTIPHPAMHYRRFVLAPLNEIAPELRHPAGWRVADRWDRLNRPPHYLALTGPMGVGKTTLARELAARLRAELVEEQFDSVRLGKYYAGDGAEAEPVQNFFFASRIELLERDRWARFASQWVVSDFWFAQSLAYSHVLLTPDARRRHAEEVRAASDRALEPSLVIWLDAPGSELKARVAARGREFEAPVSEKFLSDLQQAYDHVLTGPDAPPLYRPRETTLSELIDELLVVAQAITGD